MAGAIARVCNFTVRDRLVFAKSVACLITALHNVNAVLTMQPFLLDNIDE